jgi:acyl-CoA thioesterase FadM
MANRANGVVAAICEITGVSLNFETRRSQALPEEILDRARALVVDYDFAAVRPGG